MKTQNQQIHGKVFAIDFSGRGLVPLENPGLPVGQIVSYEDRANPRKDFAVISAPQSGQFAPQHQNVICLEDGHASQIHATRNRAGEIEISGHWTIEDRVLSAEELRAALATAEENKKRIAEEQKQAEEIRAKKRAEKRAALLAKYGSTLEQVKPGEYASAAHGAKNLRKELKAAFPCVKFSVRSETYSGGDSINVSWQFGPTVEQVKKITAKYEEGHFNGMEDIYETNYENQWPDLFGGAKYVMESRGFSEETHEQIGRALCELQRIEYRGGWQTRGLLGENDTRDLQQHINILLAETSWPTGATFKGVESTDDGQAAFFSAMFKKYGQGWLMESRRAELSKEDRAELEKFEAVLNRHWCRIVFDTPAAAKVLPCPEALPQQCPTVDRAPESGAQNNGVTVRHNREKNGVEIQFATKPAADVLAQLKANGWRWSRFAGCWYARRNSLAVTFAVKLAGLTDEQAKELFSDEPAAISQDSAKMQEQIELAREMIVAKGYTVPACVTESRLTADAKKTWWGYCFKVGAKVGDEYQNEDGSFSVVRAIVGNENGDSLTAENIAKPSIAPCPEQAA